MPDHPRNLIRRSGAGVDIGLAQFGDQKMVAAENIQRQITIAVVIAVEEAALLFAVQRIVRGVQIENDFLGRAFVGFEKQIDQQLLDRRAVMADLVVKAGRLLRPLQTVQGRLAGNRRAIGAARLQFAGQHRKQGIVPQGIVIVEVLIPQRQAKNPLPRQRRHRMLDKRGSAPVDETLGKPLDKLQSLVGAAQLQRPRVGSDRAPIKTGHNLTVFNGSKIK